ncbi:MAG: trimeric intracellular cation channel family protein [Verrucomicrobiales bacterium]|nr:trimeric intracellular cation channel family protein [Verrucomicrobiota bacterium JB025]
MLVLEFMAVIISATYGFLLAARAKMDFIGSFTVASLAAFGGGTLRDIFLDLHPLFWIGKPHYPLSVFALCIILPFLTRLLPRIKPILIYPDALGMALFTTVGTAISLEAQPSAFIAVLLGTITGTFGGVLADVVCNEIPSLFTPTPFCATCAFTGSWLYILGDHLQWHQTALASATILTIVVFRILSVHLNWKFPPIRDPG